MCFYLCLRFCNFLFRSTDNNLIHLVPKINKVDIKIDENEIYKDCSFNENLKKNFNIKGKKFFFNFLHIFLLF